MQEDAIITASEMRSLYFPCQSKGISDKQKDYIDYLKAQGLFINPKIDISIFNLKNGLPYVGLSARQHIGEGEILIRVPQHLILSSAKALQQAELSEVYLDSFFMKNIHNWQDRVIITYCMFLLHKKEQNNPWYLMIKHFPRQCDIACFWSQEQLNSFKDLTVTSAANLDLDSFNQEWEQFQQCQKKYQILQNAQFNLENYKTIYINLANRSFSKYINYTSLIPFAEFINHHSSKVYYSIQKQLKNTVKQEIDEGDQSSRGSYDSQRFIEQGEFQYDSVENIDFNWEIVPSEEINEKESIHIKKQCGKISKRIEEQIGWEDFTVVFVGHLFFKLKMIQKQFMQGRKAFNLACNELKIVQKALSSYKQNIIDYYKTVKHQTYNQPKPQLPKDQPLANYPAYTKQYESVILKTTKFDSFPPSNQIYFRYGRNSNRYLLLQYGFAIQGNKYQHVWLSFGIQQCLQDFPFILGKVTEKKLSLLRKFKLHHHILNIDIIIFFRLNSWMFYGAQALDQIFAVTNVQKEICILEQIVTIYESNLETYSEVGDLKDPKLNYHEYFIAVYHRQKHTILKKQIKMLVKLIKILQDMESGLSKQDSTSNLTSSEKKIMTYYLQSIR